jgi:hypothetical protein
VIGLGICSILKVGREFFTVDGGVTYVDIYACVFLANYLNTATTAIFTGWLGLALILGLIYWENGERWDRKEGRENEKVVVMVSYIWIWMGWDGWTDDGMG